MELCTAAPKTTGRAEGHSAATDGHRQSAVGVQADSRSPEERRASRRPFDDRAHRLRAEGLPPRCERSTVWSTFLRAHWPALVAADSFTTEVWAGRGLVCARADRCTCPPSRRSAVSAAAGSLSHRATCSAVSITEEVNRLRREHRTKLAAAPREIAGIKSRSQEILNFWRASATRSGRTSCDGSTSAGRNLRRSSHRQKPSP
jgi:hypothetical protein